MTSALPLLTTVISESTSCNHHTLCAFLLADRARGISRADGLRHTTPASMAEDDGKGSGRSRFKSKWGKIIKNTEQLKTNASDSFSKGKGKEGEAVRKFRGVPEDVQLFEVFWKQVVELIKVRLFESLVYVQSANLDIGPSGSVNTRHNRLIRFIDESLLELLS